MIFYLFSSHSLIHISGWYNVLLDIIFQKIFFANIILLVVLQQTSSFLPKNRTESTVSDLPETTTESTVTDLPDNKAESTVSGIPKESIPKCIQCDIFNGLYKLSPNCTFLYCQRCYEELKCIYEVPFDNIFGSNKANIPY
ncbi:uncharacterized protein LOC126902546 isoform X2 [Daktulosphaira vitifoliae]|uniref:uncharacterized protein LOC126902546 isoform X2 n=1 Tax=Daktulosphaira vitifoliae TaxID=58002 RepID=UPI0021A9D0D3|nr:uncharacterized protein LOC126902546 isoform X2 [Daktulosphaira vitifoliae]